MTTTKRVSYKALVKELVSRCRLKGIHVRFVRHKTKDYAGHNSEAAKAMKFRMPRNTIYIDSSLSDKKQWETLRHECVEMALMRTGWGYWKAHCAALKVEKRRTMPF